VLAVKFLTVLMKCMLPTDMLHHATLAWNSISLTGHSSCPVGETVSVAHNQQKVKYLHIWSAQWHVFRKRRFNTYQSESLF